MLSRKIIVVSAVVLIVSIAIIALFYPRKHTVSVMVPLPIERTIAQFTQPDRVKKWFKPFEEADTTGLKKMGAKWVLQSGNQSLQVAAASSFSVALLLSDGNRSLPLIYQVQMDSGYTDQSRVVFRYKSNVFGNFNGRNQLIEQAVENLHGLESFTSNTLRFYGLDIRRKLVTDSAYLFTQKTVARNQVGQTAASLIQNLRGYALQKKLEITGTAIVNINNLSADSVRVSTGLSTSTYFRAALTDPITYRTMPFGKRLLEAPFKGKYSDLPAAFRALELYARDHLLTNMAIPYGKYGSDQVTYSDHDLIDMLVYFPVD